MKIDYIDMSKHFLVVNTILMGWGVIPDTLEWNKNSIATYIGVLKRAYINNNGSCDDNRLLMKPVFFINKIK